MNYELDEIDDEWAVLLSEKLIDEFEDVSVEEKLFMKLCIAFQEQIVILPCGN